MGTKSQITKTLQHRISIHSPEDRGQNGSLPSTIGYVHQTRLSISPLDPAILFHVDEGKNSDNYWRKTLVQQPLEEKGELAFIKCLAAVKNCHNRINPTSKHVLHHL